MINLYLQGESYPNAPDIFHFNFITKYSIKKHKYNFYYFNINIKSRRNNI